MQINYLLVFILVLCSGHVIIADDSAANSAEGSYEDVMDADPDNDSPPYKPKSNGRSKFIPNKDELNINKPIPDLPDMDGPNEENHHSNHNDHGPPAPPPPSPNYSRQRNPPDSHYQNFHTNQPYPNGHPNENERLPIAYLYNNPAPLYRQLPVFVNSPMMQAKGTYDHMSYYPSPLEQNNYGYGYQQQPLPNQMLYQQMLYNQASMQHPRAMYPPDSARMLESPFINHINPQFRNFIGHNHYITFEPVKDENEKNYSPREGDKFFYDKMNERLMGLNQFDF